MLATSFQILYFESFLEIQVEITDTLAEKIAELSERPSMSLMETIEGMDDYQQLMTRYTTYVIQTLNGEHGSTALY